MRIKQCLISVLLAAGLAAQGAAPVMAARIVKRNAAARYSAGPSSGVSGEWQRDDRGWWFRRSDGTWPAAAWLKVKDIWYRFDPEGYMQTGWFEENGLHYYMDPESGAMTAGTEREIGGVVYSFDDSGAAVGVNYARQPVVIPPEEQKNDTWRAMDAICDSVLAAITTPEMGERQKAEAIYRWIRGNFRYAGHSATRDWVTEAYQGLRRHHGDCYTYFAVAQALLTRAGLPSIEVIRSTDNDHFWNLTMVDGSWYHFDATPRSWGGTYCLLTDSQMLALSRAHGNCFHFDQSLYPPTP